jgi:hypothetical protein
VSTALDPAVGAATEALPDRTGATKLAARSSSTWTASRALRLLV